MEFISFEPNQPQELALAVDSGPFKLPGGCGCLFSLQGGRTLHLSERTAQSLADVWISGCKAGWITLWERENAA